MEFIKVQRQLEGVKLKRLQMLGIDPPTLLRKNSSTLSWGSHIIKNYGFLALYKGFPSHLLRDIIGTSFFFSCYETIKYILTPYAETDSMKPFVHLFAGGAAVCTYLRLN